MMQKISRFYEAVKNSACATLATASKDHVTMRTVSPVSQDGGILIFTDPHSNKYRQLKANPRCCIAVGEYFAEATAEFCGETMLEANEKLREAYCAKFPDAFEEGVAGGGRDAEFILLTPTRLKGWAFENDVPTADGIPTVPFEIDLS